MKVVWTEEALAHLDDIHRYISRDAPLYALRMVDELTRRSQQLLSYPESGRVVPEYADRNVRELIVYPYRLVYRLHKERLDVIAVFHGARRFPETL